MSEKGTAVSQKKVQGARGVWMTIYCIGNVGYELMYEFFKNFQNFFLTEICGFSTGLTGTVITVVNIAKAIFTPISGMIIDKDPFRAKDRHTPWIRIMPIFLGGLYVLMTYLAWKGASAVAILTVFCVFYFLPVLLQNGYRSAIPSIAMNSNESSFLAGGINVCSNIGRLLTGVIVPVILVKMSADGKTEDAQGFFWAVLISVILTIIVYWLSSFGVRKTIRPDQVAKAVGKQAKKATMSFGAIVKQIFTDKNILVPFIIGLAVFFRTFLVSPSAPYFFKYVTGDMLQYATFSTASNVTAILGTIIAPIVVATIFKDTKKVCLISIVAQILCHVSLFFVGSSTAGFIIMMSVCNFFYSWTSVLLFTMFVDAVDVAELKARKAGSGKVASGTAISLHFTAVMFAQVLGGYIRNFALAKAGYIGQDTVASPELTKGLVSMFAVWPILFLAIGFVAVFFYTLTPQVMADIHKELDPMRKAASAAAAGQAE